MNMQQPYSHPPIEWINEDGERECRRNGCGRRITGYGNGLRHVDEIVPPLEVSPAEAAILKDAAEAVREALEAMWTDRCSDRDRAQVAVEALHMRGFIPKARPRAKRTRTSV